ncbi:uncharacterized protein EI90DRAFT_1576885 [Cantharellus anzutake]|uniref:uncharacterized protein n=1 Tax=Cantharellus anzutake TaxID=1750568 RepID=UPI00190789E8|nr:uncharacterized protein EI90DRAFT_1576885 [Cantharellus anzutake]KAF8328432.1 hypothetical protein EI90DRAFT_1576885 [Cantharellus anzutake]
MLSLPDIRAFILIPLAFCNLDFEALCSRWRWWWWWGLGQGPSRPPTRGSTPRTTVTHYVAAILRSRGGGADIVHTYGLDSGSLFIYFVSPSRNKLGCYLPIDRVTSSNHSRPLFSGRPRCQLHSSDAVFAYLSSYLNHFGLS